VTKLERRNWPILVILTAFSVIMAAIRNTKHNVRSWLTYTDESQCSMTQEKEGCKRNSDS
jgi:uncharacterized membrane protein